MTDMVAQNFKMTGCFDVTLFRDWVMHRARILNLDIDIKAADGSTMELLAKGHPVLVEAFEIACSLGPTHSIVDDIFAHEAL